MEANFAQMPIPFIVERRGRCGIPGLAHSTNSGMNLESNR